MFKTALYVTVAAFALLINTALAVDEIPDAVQKVISKYKIPDSSISLMVQDVDSFSPRLSLNAQVPRNPASSIKLLTTFVALDVLGPTYTWPTKLYALGPIKDGVLDGDLVLKGYGNPYLVVEEFWKMLGELHAIGVESINGDLIIDDSHFDVPDLDPGAFDRQPDRLYNVVPNAALINFKAVEFQFFPAGDGKNVHIRARPPLPNLKITNQLSVTQAACRGYQIGIKMVVPDRVNADHVVFFGRFSIGMPIVFPASQRIATGILCIRDVSNTVGTLGRQHIRRFSRRSRTAKATTNSSFPISTVG